MKLRKIFSVLAAILMSFSLIPLLACPIVVQVFFPSGYFLHLDSMFGGALRFFINQFSLLLEGNILAIASVATLFIMLVIFVMWIVFSSRKKHKSGAAIVFGAINMIITYFYLMIFVFDTSDVIYKGTVECAKGDVPLLFGILPGTTYFHVIFTYGMFVSLCLAGTAFLFVLIAFLGDVCSKKAPEKKRPLTPEEKAAKKAAQKQAEDDRLRQIIREELARHNDQVTEEQVVAAVSAPQAEEQPAPAAEPVIEQPKVEEPVVEAPVETPEVKEVEAVDAAVAPVVEAEKVAEETPAPVEEPTPVAEAHAEETPAIAEPASEEPQYNKLDPIEKIFADIESNRPELDNPLPKKGEAITPKLEEAKKEEEKPQEMTIEEKMEAGIKDAPVKKPQEEKEEEDDIERLEDEHLD